MGNQIMRFVNMNLRLSPHTDTGNSNVFTICRTWEDFSFHYDASNYSGQFGKQALFLFTVDNRIRGRDYANPKMQIIDIATMNCVSSVHLDSQCYVLNPCNGLLFILKCYYDSICPVILNPFTLHSFKLPGPKLQVDIYKFGFGFSPTTKQYKVFKFYNQRFTLGCTLEVLTLGTIGTHQGRWRLLCCHMPFALCTGGVYLDGVIYWIGVEKDKDDEYAIYALDVESEFFEESVVHLQILPHSYSEAYIQPLNGTIYAMVFIDGEIRSWKMRGKDDWITDFVIHDIPKDKKFTLVKVSEEGEILFIVEDDLFRLNKNGRKKKIKAFQRVMGISHIESLI